MARKISVRFDNKTAALLEEYQDWTRQFGMEITIETAVRDMAVVGLAAWENGYADMREVGLERSGMKGPVEGAG